MKNRAKCKLCNSIIESFHSTDCVECKCGEISVSNGAAMYCGAKNWNNFIRIDDEENEIIPTITDTKPTDIVNQVIKNKKDLFDMLDEMIKSYERLPLHAQTSPASNADLCSALMLIKAIFSAEN